MSITNRLVEGPSRASSLNLESWSSKRNLDWKQVTNPKFWDSLKKNFNPTQLNLPPTSTSTCSCLAHALSTHLAQDDYHYFEIPSPRNFHFSSVNCGNLGMDSSRTKEMELLSQVVITKVQQDKDQQNVKT